jgi:16S rRNA (guanine966-N2)-methyltransferase
VRVIAGAARGRRLLSPAGSRIRPTSDRVKEALFSIITAMIGSFSGISVLDVFAGTGNLGIEAISRGAARAVFIDNHQDSVTLVKKNLHLTGFSDISRVLLKDAVTALKTLENSDGPFRLVFIDPPYHKELPEKVLQYLSTSNLLDEKPVIVAELSSKDTIIKEFGRLYEFDRRTYGDTALVFYTISDRGKP